MKIKEDRFFNYILSMGFVILVVIFFIFMITISRYVLSDKNIIQEHVQSTKNLLEDIEKVEESVERNQYENSIVNNLNISIDTKISNYDKEIIDTSYANLKNKSLITFKLNKNIFENENYYYLNYSNFKKINIKDIILYDENKKGIIIEIDSDNSKKIIIYNSKEQKTDTILFDEIKGKIIYEKND